MLKADNLTFSYDKHDILTDVSFCVEQGECLVVTGANGSGKSTLLSILSGVVKPKSGNVITKGKLALVPQGNSVFEDMTVMENIKFFANLAGNKNIKKLPFDLDKYAKTKASKLSGGYKKRLNVACSLVSGPDIWLFDEPCANLDEKWRGEIIKMVKACKNRGCAIIYVGHDPAEYEEFYDKILHIENGKGTVINRG